MNQNTASQRLPGYRLQPTLETVQRFRAGWARYHKPDDINHLLRLFRKVELQSNYQLDYLALGRGDVARIWPFARAVKTKDDRDLPKALEAVPPDRMASAEPGGALRQVEVDTLYRYLSYEHSAQGLAEYAFFVPEMWALKSEGWASEWLSLEPLVVRHRFDSVLRKAGSQLVRVARPDHYDPEVVLSPLGGTVQFIAYQPGPWRRIVRIEIKIDRQGFVSWQTQDVIASLQRR
jgi:hypothetical protein